MKLYKSFIVSNLLALAFLLFFPAKSASGSLTDVLILNGFFLIITIIFSLIPIGFCYKKNQRIVSSTKNALDVIRPLSIISVISPILIFVDRVFVRGISYTDGLRASRYQWLQSETGSILGVAGNILSAYSYVGFFITIYFLDGREKGKYITVYGLIIATLAALNGGRSNVFLAIVLWLAANLLRDKKPSNTYKRINYIFLFLAFYYTNLIIKSSAQLGAISTNELVILGIGDLYGVPDELLATAEIPELICFILYALVYLYHGQWTSQAALELTYFPGHYAFISLPLIFLEKLGIVNISSDTTAFEGGVFLSLPGAYYYDFGYTGVFFCAASLGISLGISIFMLRCTRILSTVKITTIIATFFILVLSPIAPAYGFAYFSYIIFGFISLGLIGVFFPRFNLHY